MKMRFEVITTSLANAAEVEAVLDSLENVSYTVVPVKNRKTIKKARTAPRKSKAIITIFDLIKVHDYRRNHPKDNNMKIARALNLSDGTVWRIVNNKHTLSAEYNKTYNKSGKKK